MNKILIIILLFSVNTFAKSELFIRASQVGYAPSDVKSAVVLSSIVLNNEKFEIVNSKDKKNVFTGFIGRDEGKFGKFKHSYKIDFSSLKEMGKYRIVIKPYRSIEFKIGEKIYAPIVEELMKFFPVQRCGYTNPKEHEICHIADATSLFDNGNELKKTIDVTGGWHDAGDYVKFLNTTAVTTYTLLFAFDFNSKNFGFDYNKNNIPDILEEAKVGLDWMLRTQTDDNRFITQVQNLQDHDVGWRLPENDSLAFNRPAYIGTGKNIIGIYSATMALASRIWKKELQNNEFAEKCLKSAEKYYAIKDHAPDIDSSGTGQYFDKSFEGKLALGAIELYDATKERKYLSEARKYGKLAGAEYWWSYGNISTFAHYRLAKYSPSFLKIMEQSLSFFNTNRNSNLFGETVSLGWGSNVTQIGTAIQAILYKERSGSMQFDSLIVSVRDYLLGKNSWGISFVSNIGKVYSKNLHHQVSFMNKITLPGGFAAGPTSKSSLDSYNLPFARRDKYSKFQTEAAYYRDDRMDYVTNEPTIIGNAMAILLFGSF